MSASIQHSGASCCRRKAASDARAALESLCRTYRPPVLAYIRSRGYRSDVAEDLTQSFFARFSNVASYPEADPRADVSARTC